MPASPRSVLLDKLGLTREELDRHANQMRQFLAPPDAPLPLPLPLPPPPPPPPAAPMEAPPPLTPRHYRANVYDSLASSSARRPLVFASSSPYYRASPASSSPNLPLPPPPPAAHALPAAPAPLPFTLPPGPYPQHKPDLPYAALIGRALLASPQHRLTLQDIYEYISRAFPFFRRGETTWMNSIRHVLSTTPVFRKVPRERAAGRTLWAVWDEDVPAFDGGGFDKDKVREMREAKEARKRAAAAKEGDKEPPRKAKRARTGKRREPSPPPAPAPEPPAAPILVPTFPPLVASTSRAVYADDDLASNRAAYEARYADTEYADADQHAAARAAYEARYRDEQDDAEELAAARALTASLAASRAASRVGSPPAASYAPPVVKLEQHSPPALALAASRAAYEARFADDDEDQGMDMGAGMGAEAGGGMDVGDEAEAEDAAVRALSAARAAYEAKYADDDDDEEEDANPSPDRADPGPSYDPDITSTPADPDAIARALDYAGRPGYLSDDPDDYLSFPEDDAPPPPRSVATTASASASASASCTPPGAALVYASGAGLGERERERDCDALPSPPRTGAGKKGRRWESYLASPDREEVGDGVGSASGSGSADGDDGDEYLPSAGKAKAGKRRVVTRAAARGGVQTRRRTKAHHASVPPLPPPPQPESPTPRRAPPRRFSTPPRNSSPSPPPPSSFASLRSGPLALAKSASFTAPLPPPPAFAPAPARFRTPSPPRARHAVSAERTPLSYEGVHAGPSPSLAHFKRHLLPPTPNANGEPVTPRVGAGAFFADPHDPRAALDEEMRRFDAPEGTPAGGGMGFARAMLLYASPLGAYGGGSAHGYTYGAAERGSPAAGTRRGRYG